MNAKKAKAARALVRQLQDKEVINAEWSNLGWDKRTGAAMNDPASGRGFYQRMKKQAN